MSFHLTNRQEILLQDSLGLEGLSPKSFAFGLEKCSKISLKRPLKQERKRTRNPRFAIGDPAKSVLIKNATLIDGDGSVMEAFDIILNDGLIQAVGPSASLEFSTESLNVINANGRFVTPGIVDMHSHVGLDSWPETEGNSDTNEMSGLPLHPELRALDGFDPSDIAIDIINSGGITTSLVLPGSGNLMGGEAYAIKHRRMKSNRVEDMLLNAGMNTSFSNGEDGPEWRWMKMACGENALMSSRRKGIMGESRLGEGFLFRTRLNDAKKVMIQQDEWCYKAKIANASDSSAGHRFIHDLFPDPIEQETLIALLRGEILLNVHCYQPNDIEMMVRLSHEFNFKIRAFHHALEAWKVAELLAHEGIGVALFADHFGYKKEAYGISVKGPSILAKNGVKVAFKSDHPVLNG